MAGLFEKQSELYASARPNYSTEWYAKLASLTTHHKLAWDVGTGNGQAALGAAECSSLSSDLPPQLPEKPKAVDCCANGCFPCVWEGDGCGFPLVLLRLGSSFPLPATVYAADLSPPLLLRQLRQEILAKS